MAEEVWKDIQFFEGMYQVSTLGRVRSVDRYDRLGRLWKGKIRSQQKCKNGYYYIKLCKDRIEYQFRVHRLVAMAFIPIPDDLKGFGFDDLKVDHIDTHTDNNTVENLRWTTIKGNLNNPLTIRHRMEAGLYPKKVVQMTKNNSLVKIWDSAYQVQKETGYFQSNISNCCKYKMKQAYGYKWVFYPYWLMFYKDGGFLGGKPVNTSGKIPA